MRVRLFLIKSLWNFNKISSQNQGFRPKMSHTRLDGEDKNMIEGGTGRNNNRDNLSFGMKGEGKRMADFPIHQIDSTEFSGSHGSRTPNEISRANSSNLGGKGHFRNFRISELPPLSL